MIPDRIFVQGFLCYREPQEASFNGGSLWMIAGRNGSGKSALFDALTYALYGRHRAGCRNASGLIHHDSTGLVVELDFTLGDHKYRARRTLDRNGRCTRQIYAWQPGMPSSDTPPDGPPGRWSAVPETQTQAGFARWVRHHLALSFETFTASVLLLQGQAETLLLAGPARRYALLQQLVGLEKLEQLHQHARAACTEARGAVRLLGQQHKAIRPVTGHQVDAATHAWEQATHHRRQCTSRTRGLEMVLEHSQHWKVLRARQDQLRQAIQDAEQVRAAHATHAADRRRLDFLDLHLPHLSKYIHDTARCAAARAAIDRLAAEQRTLAARHKRVAGNGRRWQRVQARIEQLIQQAGRQLERAAEQRAVRAAALPHWERLVESREMLRTYTLQIATRQTRLERVRSLWNRGARTIPPPRTITDQRATVQRAQIALSQAQLLDRQLTDRLARLHELAGSATCPCCGQALTQTHVVAERARVAAEQMRVQQTMMHRADQHARETGRLSLLEQRRRIRAARLQKLDKHRNHLSTELAALRQAACKARAEGKTAYARLPRAWQLLVPQEQAGALPAATRSAATDVAHFHQAALHADQDIERTRHRRDILLARRARVAARQTRDQLARERTARDLQNIAVRLATGRANAAAYAEAAKQQQDQLPDAWKHWTAEEAVRQRNGLIAEQEAIRNRHPGPEKPGGPLVLERLPQLRGELKAVREQLATIADEARRDPIEVRRDLAVARAAGDDAERKECAARASHDAKVAAAERGARIKKQLTTAQHHARLWQRLAVLLGPADLQSELMHSAETAIVQAANHTLDRLASGSIHLEQCARATRNGSSANSLDLVARTAEAPNTPIEIGFLSGSQRFRVAVALALAIGQFATGTGRPVQAVIIDEGFGCLDRVNRQVMIQELNGLRSCLERILLVSHQVEFTAAFANGYYCEQTGGTSRLRPFHG